MTSTFKTPRTAIQDYTKGIATEKTLRVSRKRQPLSRSPGSKDGSVPRPGGSFPRPGGSAAKVSRSSSFSELSEDTPRHLITGFLTTHGSTLPLTRHQSRIGAERNMPPSSSRSKAKQNRRRSSLGIPQVDDIVKKFTPRTAIQGLLSQVPEQTPVAGNMGDRKSRSYNSLPGVDSLLRDPSFEPLHKSYVGDFPSTGKQRPTTRQHRPIQLDVAWQQDDGDESGNEIENSSARKTSTHLHISSEGDVVSKSPQSAGRRKSQGKTRSMSTSMTDKDLTTSSANRHQSLQTDMLMKETAEYSPSRRKSHRNETETNISERRLPPQPETLSDPAESVVSPSVRASSRTILLPLSPRSRRISQAEEDVRSKTFHEFASQTSPAFTERTDAATSVSPRSRRSSFQIDLGRSNVSMESTRGRRSSQTQPISVSVDQSTGTQTSTPSKSRSLHKQAMFNASHTAYEDENIIPSPVGRSRLQASRVEHIENIVPSPTNKRHSSLKQTTIDSSLAGQGASSHDISGQLHSSHRQSVGVGTRSSIADDSRMSSSNLQTRQSQIFDSSSFNKGSRQSVDTSILAPRRKSSTRTSSPGQINSEDSMAQHSSSRRSSLLRQINSEPDLAPQSSSKRQSSLRQISSESDFISQNSSQKSSSFRPEGDVVRQSTPRRSSILQHSLRVDEFAEDTDEIDGDEISSVVQSVIGQLASENDVEEEDEHDENAVQEVMAAHEEEDEVEDGDEEMMEEGEMDNHMHKNSHIDPTEKPVTKTPKPRKPRKQPEPHLPVSVVKGLFTHFSRARVSREAIAEVINISGKFWKSIAGDLESYAKHAQRKTIMDEDITLLMRRQGFVTNKKSLNSLVHQYLPLELREQVIPIARSGNKIELGKKYIK